MNAKKKEPATSTAGRQLLEAAGYAVTRASAVRGRLDADGDGGVGFSARSARRCRC